MPGVAEAVQAVWVLGGEEGEADVEEAAGEILLGRVSLGLQERGSKCEVEMKLLLQNER